jgi:GNAT superfamily N-acetyltransferase
MTAIPRQASSATRFQITLPVEIRRCAESDLPLLEWFGMFTPHREIIRATFDRQGRGEELMLVADVNGFPAGQIWIDLAKKKERLTGILWAVRVFPIFQGHRLGVRLVRAAESALRRRGFTAAELGVETDSDTGGFYERLGYRPVGTLTEECCYSTPSGEEIRVHIDQIVYRKSLERQAEA